MTRSASKRIGKVIKGKRLGGHYGATRETSKNLIVMRVDGGKNLLYLKGSVAGPNNGYIQVRTARTGVKKAPVVAAAPTKGKKG